MDALEADLAGLPATGSIWQGWAIDADGAPTSIGTIAEGGSLVMIPLAA